jgi:hypothetical protein
MERFLIRISARTTRREGAGRNQVTAIPVTRGPQWAKSIIRRTVSALGLRKDRP